MFYRFQKKKSLSLALIRRVRIESLSDSHNGPPISSRTLETPCYWQPPFLAFIFFARQVTAMKRAAWICCMIFWVIFAIVMLALGFGLIGSNANYLDYGYPRPNHYYQGSCGYYADNDPENFASCRYCDDQCRKNECAGEFQRSCLCESSTGELYCVNFPSAAYAVPIAAFVIGIVFVLFFFSVCIGFIVYFRHEKHRDDFLIGTRFRRRRGNERAEMEENRASSENDKTPTDAVRVPTTGATPVGSSSTYHPPA